VDVRECVCKRVVQGGGCGRWGCCVSHAHARKQSKQEKTCEGIVLLKQGRPNVAPYAPPGDGVVTMMPSCARSSSDDSLSNWPVPSRSPRPRRERTKMQKGGSTSSFSCLGRLSQTTKIFPAPLLKTHVALLHQHTPVEIRHPIEILTSTTTKFQNPS
jgi:hypothetical protein